MTKMKFITVSIVFFSTIALFKYEQKPDNLYCAGESSYELNENDPPCIQMYYYIEKYSEQYNIPRKYAYGIAFKETGYRGPFHWKYNHALTSSAGALGPMQVMPATATYINGEKVTNEKLMTDIEFNVETSMKLLQKLKNRYKDWKLVFGAYNTGRPMVNQYAEDVYNFEADWSK